MRDSRLLKRLICSLRSTDFASTFIQNQNSKLNYIRTRPPAVFESLTEGNLT